jgi:integrase
MIAFDSILGKELSEFYALREATLSKDTLAHNRASLLHFDRYLAENGVAEKELSEKTVSGWMQSLSVHNRTLVNKVTLIRLFARHLNSIGVKAFIPEIPKSVNDYVPYLFSDDELKRIFESADNIVTVGNRTSCQHIRLEFPMVLRMLYGCGLRIGEVLSLKIEDVDFDGGILIMKYTKGDKQRLVPMHESLASILRQYCLVMGLLGKPQSPLFPSTAHGIPMQKYVARDRFTHILRALGIALKEKVRHGRGPCLHCLRHVFAFRSFAQAERAGRSVDDSVPYLSTYLGHENLNETAKYLKFSSDLFPDALERFEDYTTDVFPEVHDYEEE